MHFLCTTVAAVVIFTRRREVRFPPPLRCAKRERYRTMVGQEIKYNAARREVARSRKKESLGAPVTATNSRKLPTKLRSSRGQLDLAHL